MYKIVLLHSYTDKSKVIFRKSTTKTAFAGDRTLVASVAGSCSLHYATNSQDKYYVLHHYLFYEKKSGIINYKAFFKALEG